MICCVGEQEAKDDKFCTDIIVGSMNTLTVDFAQKSFQRSEISFFLYVGV